MECLPRPQWIPDAHIHKCMLCNHITFNLWNRKHHCRLCGKIFCADCSEYSVKVNVHGKVIPSADAGAGAGTAVVRGRKLEGKEEIEERDIASSSSSSSSHVVNTNGHAEQRQSQQEFVYVRACQTCYEKAQSLNSISPSYPSSTLSSTSSSCFSSSSSMSSSQPSQSQILYHTSSLCVRCSFIDRIGFPLRPSTVYVEGTNVYLRIECSIHKDLPVTLLSSSLAFYRHITEWDTNTDTDATTSSIDIRSLSDNESIRGQSLDIEDVNRCLDLEAKDSVGEKILPLCFELTCYRDDAFISDEELEKELISFASHYTAKHTFVVKLNGGLISTRAEIETLNQKIHNLLLFCSNHSSTLSPILSSILSSVYFLVDLTVERLQDLSVLPNTVLLKANVFPSVRYFLSVGEEKAFVTEMRTLINVLRTIENISLFLFLSISSPCPSLQLVFPFIQENYSIIRGVIITRERSPLEIFSRLLPNSNSSSDKSDTMPASSQQLETKTETETGNGNGNVESTDIYELMSMIGVATNSKLQPTDFLPLRALASYSPLLASFGWPHYSITPSPMCAFATALINTSSLHSIPITHLYNLRLFHHLMKPSSAKWRSFAGSSSPSTSQLISTVRLIQNALKKCSLSRLPVPDVLSYLAGRDELKNLALKNFARSMQVIVIHNKMDFATVDMRRRCACAVVQPPVAGKRHVASCTQCI